MTFIDRFKTFIKSLPFPRGNGNSSEPLRIFSNWADWDAAINRVLDSASTPSSDPHLSSLVAAGVTWLANTLPEPDLQVKKEFLRKKGGKNRDDNVIEKHPVYDLFERPNPYTSGSTLWKAFAYSWVIDGNVYFIKLRNGFGQVVQLWYEPHFNIRARWVNDQNGEYILGDKSQSVPSVERDDRDNQFINYYEVDRNGIKFRLEPADVVHFRDGIDPFNTRRGLSRLSTILREIYGDSAVASYAAQLLAGNGVIPYVLGIEDKEGSLGQEDLENIKAKLIAQTTGANSGKPLVLSSRMTFSRTGLTPQEMDLRAARSMAQDVFSQVTGIPAIVLNFSSGMERSIYHNMQEADRQALQRYLVPLWWHIAQELTHQLLPDLDADESHFIEFYLDEVAALQENTNDIAKRMVELYTGGLIKRSWGQRELGYEPDPGGADDVYFVGAGSSTVTIEGEQAAQELAANPPPPPPQFGEPTQPPMDKKMKLVKSLSADEQKIREHWERHAPERVKGLISARSK